jgi:uncharacterized protein (DUF885 family)
MHSRALTLLLPLIVASSVETIAQQPTRPDYPARYSAITRQPGADSARLHQLFDLDWEYNNVDSPEFATYTGYPGQNARWTDLSVPAINRRRAELNDRLAAIRSIDRSKLNPADQLSYDVFKRGLDEAIEGLRFPSDVLQITQRDGPQYMSYTIDQMPATAIPDYNDIIARLRGIPAVIDQTIALLDSGLKLGVTPPRVTLRDVPKQIEDLIPSSALKSPLLGPLNRIPESITGVDRARLLSQAENAYTTLDRPAYQRLHDYLVNTYIPRARESIAASALPNGGEWYAYNVRVQTTTSRTPREIHDLGLSEVKRIRAEMDSVMRAIGFKGDFATFTTMLRTDPQFFYTDSASLVRAYRDIAKRIDPELPKLFGRLPRLTYGVATIPSYAAPSQTTAYYSPGSPESRRPGRFFVNTYKLETRPTWEMEALTAHEAVPGHHLQIAISQELADIPQFRRYGGYTAFVEGWGLYAESLGPEIGLYEDSYSKFGQLTYEIWRAIRLVIDTGIHSFGWTRQQAIDYFVANSAKTENDITQEVDRYIVWPGQALAYKSGELEIKSLRAFAEQQLGPSFDIRAFHDLVLSQGALPLDILDTRVRAWVSDQKTRKDVK